MKFRNPWIDPRVFQVNPADAEAYLLQHGWKSMTPITSGMVPFQRAAEEHHGPIVNVPQRPDMIDYPQRVIDMIAAVACAEDRWATEVLSDILAATNAPAPVNGPSTARAAESAAS